MSQSGQSIDALVDDAIRAAEQLDLGQTGQVQQYGQPGGIRPDNQRKISPPSPASLASSQMQTQIGPGYPGPASPYGYASTASSSPAFPLPYSPHRSPASGQYYSDGFQYAYHNRFYNPSYQYPPVNDPSLMYQAPYANGMQQQYWQPPSMQYYTPENQYYEQQVHMGYHQQPNDQPEPSQPYTSRGNELAYSVNGGQIPVQVSSPMSDPYGNVRMQSPQYAQQPPHLYRPVPFAPPSQPISTSPVNSRQQNNGPSVVEPLSPSSRPLPELARGHQAQANLHNAIWGRPAPIPNQYPEQPYKRRSNNNIRNALPKPPPHSDFALWAGNVPSDATHNELWRFFNSRPSPAAAGITSYPDLSLVTNSDNPPDLRIPGVESIHLIARSNCCFVNYASQVHLEQAIKASHGISLRPYDPRNKDLVCRVRKKGDDAKTGVGAQRGRGMHQQWTHDQEAEEGTIDGDRQISHRVSLSTQHSNSTGTASTSSSFLSSNFAKRYFVLKSLSEEDLALSVKNGLWATQSHNEPVLDKAFRTSHEGVFLIFSANKSGEFFGFAKMAGSISKLPNSSIVKGSSSEGPAASSSMESGTSSLRQANMTIMEGEAFASPGALWPTIPQTDSPQPATPYNTVKSPSDRSHPAIAAARRGASAPTNSLGMPSSGALAPRPAQSLVDAKRAAEENEHEESLAERRGAPIDVEKMVIGEDGTREFGVVTPTGNAEPSQKEGEPAKSTESSAEEKQEALGSTSHEGIKDENGVIRKDTLLTPEERNARLEEMDDLPSEQKKDSFSSDKGWSRPFPLQWIKVQRLPFHRTRHLKNAFNQNREVKISRDGTELDPVTGEQLIQEFFRVGAPESPYKESLSPSPAPVQ